MRTACLLLGLLVACGHPDAPATPMQSEHDALSAQIQAADQRMHARFGAAKQIEYSVARSDLDAARANAHVIVALDEPYLARAWQPFLIGVRGAARQIELAPDIMLAATRTGALGQRCAECHEGTHAPVQMSDDPRPVDDPRASRMPGHQWAALRMWEGLFAPSQARWDEGALALTTVPLNMVASAVTPSFQGDLDDVAKIRLLARQAPAATTNSARAQLFGSLLSACAHCHAVLRDR
ncbi:MAG TPA: hypothetical protein VFQ65_04765 [Kofleriaceae bacterium]|nr:hypothetical protein [Kofleriaceae bacterium]